MSKASRVQAAANESVPVSERFRITQVVRLVFVGLTLLMLFASPEVLEPDDGDLLRWTLGFLAVTGFAELVARLLDKRLVFIFSAMLMVDGLYLATAAYLTGGTTSPLRYAMVLHLGAVCLLASYRTGVKLAVWHSLLLIATRNLVEADVLPDTTPSGLVGYGSPDQRLTIFIVVLWLVAISTSTLSAINERELRRRRGDLEALTRLAEQI